MGVVKLVESGFHFDVGAEVHNAKPRVIWANLERADDGLDKVYHRHVPVIVVFHSFHNARRVVDYYCDLGSPDAG
jgi:hypothetical protein